MYVHIALSNFPLACTKAIHKACFVCLYSSAILYLRSLSVWPPFAQMKLTNTSSSILNLIHDLYCHNTRSIIHWWATASIFVGSCLLYFFFRFFLRPGELSSSNPSLCWQSMREMAREIAEYALCIIFYWAGKNTVRGYLRLIERCSLYISKFLKRPLYFLLMICIIRFFTLLLPDMVFVL